MSQKPTVLQLVRNSPVFYGTMNHLHSQQVHKPSPESVTFHIPILWNPLSYTGCFWNRRPYIGFVFHGPKQTDNFIEMCVRGSLVSTLWPIWAMIKMEQFTYQTQVRLPLGWLDCYCHFQIHSARISTFHNRCSKCAPFTVTREAHHRSSHAKTKLLRRYVYIMYFLVLCAGIDQSV
jgi:hypothetical protein